MKTKKNLIIFIEKQGFKNDNYQESAEKIEPFYIEEELDNGRTRRTQNGFSASQEVVIRSKDLALISKSYKEIIDYKSAGHHVEYAAPDYLVSNLEEIKISLIHASTENAKLRAKEFIKESNAELGTIRSASQGTFNIMSNSSNQDMSEYGGSYDKTTIDKIVRVVVTVEYNLK